MVTSIARQSVLIKCNMQASIMLGNYEFYYGAGLFLNIVGDKVEEDIKPQELYRQIEPKLETFQSEDNRETHLVKLLHNYKPLDEYDEQMKELLLWGLAEEQIWQVQI